MSAPLLATRDALAAAECSCGHPVGEGWHTSRGCVYLGVGLTACSCKRDWPDALLASSVVRDPATLADAVERRFRIAAELVVQDVRGQRGDHIASLVEDSFAAHFARAAALAEGGAA